jgi:uncharacterized protein YqhQ
MSNKNQQPTLNYGGQAVIEGVMMRGSQALSVAVRNPRGEIVVHTESLNQRVYGGRWFRTPFVRGMVLLWDALGLGIKSLMFSADVAMDESGEHSANPAKAFSAPVQIGTVLLSLALSIGLFFVLPAFLGGLVERYVTSAQAGLLSHIVEGSARLLLLVGYISAIGLMEDVRRLYGYHGAEHKTINAWEAGAELTPESVARYPIEHPRCGTAFLLTVVILSIILFSLLPLDPLVAAIGAIPARVVSRILLLPIVAGIAYEYIRLTARHQDNRLVQLLIRPNLALQRLTTRQPDHTMLEVAIAAFTHVLAHEKKIDNG